MEKVELIFMIFFGVMKRERSEDAIPKWCDTLSLSSRKLEPTGTSWCV